MTGIFLSKTYNSDSAAKNLLLIHGWGFNSAIWQNNIEELESKFNVYCLDLNGHGNSAYHKSYKNIDLYLSDIVDSLPSNTNILGWSLGGIIALLLKDKHPDKIDNITLCCCSPLFKGNSSWQYGIDASVWDSFSDNLLENPIKTIKKFLLLNTINNKHSKDLYKSLSKVIFDSKTANLESLKWGLNILNIDHRDLLNSIDHNSLQFIFAEKDKLINIDLMDWLNMNYPNIKTSLIKKSGHIPFVTNRTEFNKELYKHLEQTND